MYELKTPAVKTAVYFQNVNLEKCPHRLYCIFFTCHSKHNVKSHALQQCFVFFKSIITFRYSDVTSKGLHRCTVREVIGVVFLKKYSIPTL